MNFFALFTLVQAIFASVKETPGSFELDLTARINLSTGHFLGALHILGYSHNSVLTIDAGDDNSLPELAFGSDAAPAPSLTLIGLLQPTVTSNTISDELCLVPGICPLPSGLIPGLLVRAASSQVTPSSVSIILAMAPMAPPVRIASESYASTHVSTDYSLVCIVIVLSSSAWFFCISQNVSVRLRINATPMRRISLNRSRVNTRAFVQHLLSQSSVPFALDSSLPVISNFDALSAANIVDICDPTSIARIFSILGEQDREIRTRDARIESQDRVIAGKDQTLSRVTAERDTALVNVASRDNTISDLHTQYAADRQLSEAQYQVLEQHCNGLEAKDTKNSLEVMRLQKMVRELQTDKAVLESENATLKSDNAILKSDNATGGLIIARLGEEFVDAQEVFDARLGSANATIASLEDDVRTRDNTISELNASLTGTTVTLAAAAATSTSFQRQLCDKTQHNISLDSQLQAERATNAGLRADIDTHATQHAAERSDLAASHALALAAVQTDKASLEHQLHDAHACQAVAQEDLTTARAQTAELQDELEGERAGSEALRVKLTVKTAEVRKLRTGGHELIEMYEAKCLGLKAACHDIAKAVSKQERSRYDKRLTEDRARFKALEVELLKNPTTPASITTSDSFCNLNNTHAQLSARPSHGNLLDVSLSASASLAALPSFTSICAIAATSCTSLSALAERPTNVAPAIRLTATSCHTPAKIGTRTPSISKTNTAPKKPVLKTQHRTSKENATLSKQPTRTSTFRTSSRRTIKP